MGGCGSADRPCNCARGGGGDQEGGIKVSVLGLASQISARRTQEAGLDEKKKEARNETTDRIL